MDGRLLEAIARELYHEMGGVLKRIAAFERIENLYLGRIEPPAGPLKLGDNCLYADVVPFRSSRWKGRIGAKAYLRKGGRWRDVLAACDRRIGRLVEAAAPGLTVVQGVVAKDLFPELRGLRMSDAPILPIRRGGIEFPVQWLYPTSGLKIGKATPEYYAAAAAKAQSVLLGWDG